MDTHHDAPPAPRRQGWRASLAVSSALFGLVFLVSACSGGPAAPGVAATGGTTTTDPTSQAANSKGINSAALLTYSHCMQSHGIADFPDPNAQGQLQISGGPGSDLNPNNPQFVSAQKACAKDMPQPTPAQKAQALKNGLKMAQCMRAHGVTNFPDPNANGEITISGGSNGSNGIDPNSPVFQQAQNACQSIVGGPKISSNHVSAPGGTGTGNGGSGNSGFSSTISG